MQKNILATINLLRKERQTDRRESSCACGGECSREMGGHFLCLPYVLSKSQRPSEMAKAHISTLCKDSTWRGIYSRLSLRAEETPLNAPTTEK